MASYFISYLKIALVNYHCMIKFVIRLVCLKNSSQKYDSFYYWTMKHQFLKLFIRILKWLVRQKFLIKSVIIFYFQSKYVLPWSVLFWQLSTSILEAYLCIMARVLLFKTHITTAVESACRVVSSHLMISQDFLLENIPMYSFFWEGWLSQLKIKWLGPFSTDDQ